MKIIAVAAHKGGVGKTTTAVSMSHILAKEFNKKVLLIDMDSQSSSSIILGVTPTQEDTNFPVDDMKKAIKELQLNPLVYEVDELDGPTTPEENQSLNVPGIADLFSSMLTEKRVPSKEYINGRIHKPYYVYKVEDMKDENTPKRDESGRIVRKIKKYPYGFDLLPSTETLSDVSLTWASSGVDSTFAKGEQLKQLCDYIERYFDYDYVIIDCPPAIDLLSVNAMYAAKDGIIITVSQDRQSLFSLTRIKKHIRDLKQHYERRTGISHNGCLGILLTIFYEKRYVDQYMGLTVGYETKLHVFNTKISETADAKKALMSKLILTLINDRANNQYKALINEVEERISYLENRGK